MGLNLDIQYRIPFEEIPGIGCRGHHSGTAQNIVVQFADCAGGDVESLSGCETSVQYHIPCSAGRNDVFENCASCHAHDGIMGSEIPFYTVTLVSTDVVIDAVADKAPLHFGCFILVHRGKTAEFRFAELGAFRVILRTSFNQSGSCHLRLALLLRCMYYAAERRVGQPLFQLIWKSFAPALQVGMQGAE